MSSFKDFFGLESTTKEPNRYYASSSTKRIGLSRIRLPKIKLPKMFRDKKEAILNESLILRTAKRGLSLTIMRRRMQAALMVNDLEVLFLCNVWPELNYEFEKAGFRVGLHSVGHLSGTYDVIVADIETHSLKDIYPFGKPTSVFVLLGPIDIIPADEVTLIEELENLRGVIYKSSSKERQGQEMQGDL